MKNKIIYREFILKQILDKIHKEEWNNKIPSENELALLFHVSRETVRKAVSSLVQSGYLYKIQGLGTFINRTSSINPFTPLASILDEFTKCRSNISTSILNKASTDLKHIDSDWIKGLYTLFDIKRPFIISVGYTHELNEIAFEITIFNPNEFQQINQNPFIKPIQEIINSDYQKMITKIVHRIYSFNENRIYDHEANLYLKSSDIIRLEKIFFYKENPLYAIILFLKTDWLPLEYNQFLQT